jgi:hypothetical protein
LNKTGPGVGRVYNVGAGRPQTVNRLVELLQGEVIQIPKRPGEPDCTWADITRISTELGWQPQVPFEEGVRRVLENIAYWREAPLGDPESIAKATRTWFTCLGDSAGEWVAGSGALVCVTASGCPPPPAFLDQDGVINIDHGFVHTAKRISGRGFVVSSESFEQKLDLRFDGFEVMVDALSRFRVMTACHHQFTWQTCGDRFKFVESLLIGSARDITHGQHGFFPTSAWCVFFPSDTVFTPVFIAASTFRLILGRAQTGIQAFTAW